MRALLALLLAIGCATAPVAPVATVERPPAARGFNLDFEEDPDERGRPVWWMGGGQAYELAQDREIVHGGRASGRIAARDANLTGKSAGPFVQAVPADMWRGSRVRLSGWLRTRDVGSGWAALWMRVDSAEKPNIAFDNMPNRGPRGTTDWRRYEVVLDVPQEASEIFFGAILVGNGTVWVDDLKLEEVPTSVPVTAVPKT